MRIRGMKEIRRWVERTGRKIEKKGNTQLFVLVTADNRSRAMHRPRFRRACSAMMEGER